MNIARTIVNVITFILLFSTTICGLYIRYAKDKIADYNSSVNFHLIFAILTVIFVTGSIVLSRSKYPG
ncbi:MAG: hypothetical protein M0T74_03770 [Desulfitobacterium hafniense]|nr:hypothetical protein [Desulfitobacterium hafniense]